MDEPKEYWPPIMNAEQTARYLQISVRKLRDDVNSRRLPHIRLGRRILFRREAVDAALRKLEVDSV